MDRRQWIGAIGVAAGVQAAPTVRERFIGVWRLVRYQLKHTKRGVAYPYGENPVGRLTYDTAGRMSAQLMRPNRRSTMVPGVSFVTGNASTEEIREAVTGFIAYFGTFDVDEPKQTVIHHVQACLVPSWVGKDLKRKYRFDGNRLMLSAAISSAAVAELIWERE